MDEPVWEPEFLAVAYALMWPTPSLGGVPSPSSLRGKILRDSTRNLADIRKALRDEKARVEIHLPGGFTINGV